MSKYIRRWAIAWLLIISATCLIGCDLRYGIIESEFTLSPESRLPKWFVMPAGYARKDLTMTLTFYTHPIFSKVKMVVRGPAPERKILQKTIGEHRWHPLTVQKGYDKYPSYSIISVDGIEEVFEQKRLEPILYIADDPKLTEAIKQGRRSN